MNVVLDFTSITEGNGDYEIFEVVNRISNKLVGRIFFDRDISEYVFLPSSSNKTMSSNGMLLVAEFLNDLNEELEVFEAETLLKDLSDRLIAIDREIEEVELAMKNIGMYT